MQIPFRDNYSDTLLLLTHPLLIPKTDLYFYPNF